MLEERLELEEKQLGMRVDELADIYQLMSKCKSEVSSAIFNHAIMNFLPYKP